MNRLRELQDKTGGLYVYSFEISKGTIKCQICRSLYYEDLKMCSIRIFLDNFNHIKAYWPMIGRDTSQMSLNFGVNDIDGTIDDSTKIYSMAGSEEQNPSLSTQELCKLIEDVGRHPIERGTLYNIINDYKDYNWESEKIYN